MNFRCHGSAPPHSLLTIVLCFLIGLNGCNPSDDGRITPAIAKKIASGDGGDKNLDIRSSERKPLSLGLIGYNYTDRYIDIYTVDENGGGNLFVSSAGSGGGGTTCCMRYRQTGRPQTVTIRWQFDGCIYLSKSTISLEVYENIHNFMKEVEVAVDESVSTNPQYIETHFYPDGTVQVALSDKLSAPRLSLDENRRKKSKFPRCPNDEEPKP